MTDTHAQQPHTNLPNAWGVMCGRQNPGSGASGFTVSFRELNACADEWKRLLDDLSREGDPHWSH
ncbi:hypothetical protein [Kitasatospora sp. CB01950]|uniref:hypothetical protein n=1 Tax=Kitasatospora sp. CB01950 TaxID=1703930 RepID=UPI001160E3A5|nr:hypothetical protein [Kitasatospora sp. CB01950]